MRFKNAVLLTWPSPNSSTATQYFSNREIKFYVCSIWVTIETQLWFKLRTRFNWTRPMMCMCGRLRLKKASNKKVNLRTAKEEPLRTTESCIHKRRCRCRCTSWKSLSTWRFSGSRLSQQIRARRRLSGWLKWSTTRRRTFWSWVGWVLRRRECWRWCQGTRWRSRRRILKGGRFWARM